MSRGSDLKLAGNTPYFNQTAAFVSETTGYLRLVVGHTSFTRPMRPFCKLCRAAASIVFAFPIAGAAQSLDLTVNDVGLSIGDSRRATGLRINFRDRRMEEVNGVNVTVWSPYRENRGVVRGLAVGLPMTGARRIEGAGIGIFGVAVKESLHGLGIGGIGIGAGEDVEGIAVGGIGMGVGRDVAGLAIGGIGMGVGQDLRGIGVGGIGMGIGQNLRGAAVAGIGAGIGGNFVGIGVGGIGMGVGGSGRGILISGVGAGVGGDMTGLMIAGIGLGAGGNVKGLSITGIGMGAGGGATGVQLAGAGIGSGGTLKWVSVAGIGIGAPRIEGVAIASAIGAQDARGLIVAPFYFKIQKHGRMNGVNISAYNDIRGTQQGLAIGIFNYARTLDGVQIGLLNYAANKRTAKLLPLLNIARATGR